jgi:hypothetical protein
MSIRGVWQLETLLLRFCKQGGSSGGLREYIKAGGIQSFAASNPSISINVVHAAGKHPLAVGKYRELVFGAALREQRWQTCSMDWATRRRVRRRWSMLILVLYFFLPSCRGWNIESCRPEEPGAVRSSGDAGEDAKCGNRASEKVQGAGDFADADGAGSLGSFFEV